MKVFKSLYSVIYLLGAVILTAAVLFFFNRRGIGSTYSEKYAGVDLYADIGFSEKENTYKQYCLRHGNEAKPSYTVEVEINDPINSRNVTVHAEYCGEKDVILTNENSFAEWEISVPEAGLYHVLFEYCPMESRGIDAVRTLMINGEMPFRGGDCISFSRFWTCSSDIKKDNQGNEIRPMQKEVYCWASHYAEDDYSGYEQKPYEIHFNEGINTLSLTAVTEPLALRRIVLTPVRDEISYSKYVEINSDKTDCAPPDWIEVIQGESAELYSSPSLYATYDHSAPNTVPYSVSKVKLNIIGGNAWSVQGQWIQWSAEIPEDGWYNIAFKSRQNYSRGQSTVRKLLIDGESCFSEVQAINYSYSNDWKVCPVGDEADDYCFYLTKGTHQIRLEVAMGEVGSILSDMQDSVFRLNEMYRKLLMVMGRTPDKYRDYNIDALYPEMAEDMRMESLRLYELVDRIVAVSGGKSSNTGSILTLAKYLEQFSNDTELIKRRLSVFRDNITAMSAAIQDMSGSRLDIDYLVIKSTSAEWPRDDAGFFAMIAHELRLFLSSFTNDYTSLGNVYKEGEALEVWILTGRDQSNVLKTIIDDSFTPVTDIPINLKLVDAGAVLSAVVAGTGPDILLTAGQGDPVNFAMRNAVEDLSQFDDIEEVMQRFSYSAYLPYIYQDSIYALPETQYYNMLFYRKDILDELELEVPETWDDLYEMLPTLQHNNMEIGLPDVMKSDLSGFYAMMFQNGSQLYAADGKAALLDSEGAISAFEKYCEFYTNHEQPSNYNFSNRFRSGEMPIGITSYTFANTLAVFAPELKGLWEFSMIPGTRQADGSIDHSDHSTGNCCMILRQEDESKKQQCWEFLKWWTSEETQARFGTELECIMGASARYATANTEAFKRLTWSAQEMSVLLEQREFAVANREVPGGYYTGRHIVNALRRVINQREVPRETLLDYNFTINEEIAKKRAEFGLD